jgi:hypothetical protein
LKQTESLPNVAGKADIFGRTRDRGRVVVRFVRLEGNQAILCASGRDDSKQRDDYVALPCGHADLSNYDGERQCRDGSGYWDCHDYRSDLTCRQRPHLAMIGFYCRLALALNLTTAAGALTFRGNGLYEVLAVLLVVMAILAAPEFER